MTSQKPGNGNEKQAQAAKRAAAATAEDIQGDLQNLRDDVARLSQQLAKFATAKGNRAWNLAKENLDEVVSNAETAGRDAVDSIRETRDNIANVIDESIERRPYTTLAIALAMGFVAGAMWKR